MRLMRSLSSSLQRPGNKGSGSAAGLCRMILIKHGTGCLARATWRTAFGKSWVRSLYWAGEAGAAEKEASFYDSTIGKYAEQPLHRMSLQEMLKVGRQAMEDTSVLLQHAKYVQQELPKRLARRLLDLQFLPYIVVSNPHIKLVYDAYNNAFRALLDLKEVTTTTENEHLSKVLRRLVDEHTPMLDALARGVRECRCKKSVGHHLRLDSFLDNMLRSRLSRRVIAEHHINLHTKRVGFLGCVKTHVNMHSAVDHARNRAQLLCSEIYGYSPDVQVLGHTGITIPYIPTHIDYILYELLKNSMRAVIENNPKDGILKVLPPIQIRICEARDEMILRISDQGGGVPYDEFDHIWQYGYTTLMNGVGGREDNDSASAMGGGGSVTPLHRIAGLGFGLPFSRLHARYFGGDLQLITMPGYGMDTFLSLKKLEDSDWMETVDDIHCSSSKEHTG